MTVSMSATCFSGLKPASVTAMTSMPISANCAFRSVDLGLRPVVAAIVHDDRRRGLHVLDLRELLVARADIGSPAPGPRRSVPSTAPSSASSASAASGSAASADVEKATAAPNMQWQARQFFRKCLICFLPVCFAHRSISAVRCVLPPAEIPCCARRLALGSGQASSSARHPSGEADRASAAITRSCRGRRGSSGVKAKGSFCQPLRCT